jgi:hypothetical protein
MYEPTLAELESLGDACSGAGAALAATQEIEEAPYIGGRRPARLHLAAQETAQEVAQTSA